jgi:hypothetical protein
VCARLSYDGVVAPSALIRDFAQHTRDQPGIEPDVIDTLVEFKESYFGDPDPARWRTDVLRELLLDLLPRKVSAPEDWFAAVVPTTTVYLTYLRDRHRLAQGSDPAPDLLAELDRVGDRVLAASRDPRRFGMAKAIFSSVGFDAQASDPAAAAMEAFNALPFGQRAAILDPAARRSGLPAPSLDDEESWADDESWDDEDDEGLEWPDLPLTWLPPVTELAAAARSAPLVAALARLAAWNGAGHKVTRQEVLPLPDARRVCADLGLPLPAGAVRSAEGIPALHRLWSLATETGLIEIERRTARRGPAADALTGRGGDPDAVVAWWAELLEACLIWGVEFADRPEPDRPDAEDGRPDPDDDPDPDLEDAVDGALVVTLSELYGGTSVPLDDLQEIVLSTVEDDYEDVIAPLAVDRDELRRTAGRRWSAHLAQLVELGAVADTDGWISLTPLGRAGLRTLARQEGAEAPLADDPAALDAGTLLGAYPALGDLVADPLLAAWVAARGPERATAEVLDVARTGTAAVRMTAVTVLGETLGDHLRGPGRPDLEALREDPVLGFAAHLLLAEPDQEEALPPALRQWAALEGVALAAEVGALDDPDTAAVIWDTLEAQADLDSAWRSPHPQLIETLEVIAKRHPKGRVRKAAKKAIFKAGRGAAPAGPGGE